MTEAGLSVEHLTKRFRKVVAVDDVSFAVPRVASAGSSGRTERARRRRSGCSWTSSAATRARCVSWAWIPWRDRLGVLSRVGYVPERHHMYEWMRGQHVLDFVAGVYPALGLAGVQTVERDSEPAAGPDGQGVVARGTG